MTSYRIACAWILLWLGHRDFVTAATDINDPSAQPLPMFTSTSDLGSPALPGRLKVSDGTYELTAGGSDIGGTSDQCSFSYQPLVGDFDLQVRVLALSPTDPWAKAGLMVRESLAANARMAAALTSPGLAGCFFESRSSAGVSASTTGVFPANFPNTWLRLRRAGGQVTGYASFDAQAWTQLGSVALPLGTTSYVGLAVSSHNVGLVAAAQMRDAGSTTAAATAPQTLPWEPLGPSSRKTGLVISEIMYTPAPRTDGKQLEYVELFNSTPFADDISGYRLAGDVDFTFPPGTILAPGAFLVVARAPADVQAVYGITNVTGPYQGSLKSSGRVRLRNQTDAVYLEVPYSDEPPWPVAARGTGHSLVLARPSFGEGLAQAWDISDTVGGSPGQREAYRPSPLRAVMINEFLAAASPDRPPFIELYNHSNQALDISGCFLALEPGTNRFLIPPKTEIPARGFVAFNDSELGFAPSAADGRIFLWTPDASRVLDAVAYGAQESGVAAGRSPDGAGEWYRLAAPSAGAANSPIDSSEVVINEIMYAPISSEDDDQFVELYNRGTNRVNLAGWRFTAGISFTFPANTLLEPDGYLVVARNAGRLLTNYPSLNAFNLLGNFGGRLAGQGERVALAKPGTVIVTNGRGLTETNAAWFDVEELTYGPGGRWGDWAHGGGSSLELIDPHSNRRLASNWAESDESAKAPWTTLEATGVLDNGQSYNGGGGRNIEVIMLGEAECLLDNVEVFRPPNGPNLVANGTFESGLTSWTAQGNHLRSTPEAGTGYEGGQCLHIRASSRGDTGANRIRSQLTSAPTGGQTVTIRAKLRWLHGWPELTLRLHGNWFEAAGRLSVPANLGTPGARNSRAVDNAGPAIYAVKPTPILPAANEAVVITARVDDPDGLASLNLRYRLDPQTSYASVAMRDDGAAGDAVADDGVYSARIPAQQAGALAAFYLQATDRAGATARFPNDAPQRECLARFGDPAPTTSFGVYRQWFTQQAISAWNTRPSLSNERFDGTFVYGSHRVIYNFGSRYAGSPYHQGFTSPLSDGHYSIEFPRDDVLLGTDNFNKVHAPGNGPFDDDSIQREQAGFWMVRQLGLPWLYRRYVAMYVNGARRRTLMEDTQTPGAEVIEEHFPDDAKGHLYKLQPWFEFENSNAHTMGFNNNSWCTLNNYLSGGRKKLARYRWNYLVRAVHGSANDYAPVFALVDAAVLTNPSSQAAALESIADIEQWMRTFAIEHAVGNWDSVGAQNGQNMYGYKPTAGRWTLFIWDYNIVLGNSGSWGPGQNLFTVDSANQPMQRLFNNPPFRRAYWRALKEIINGPMVATNVNPIVDAKYAVFRSEGLTVAAPTGIKSWIASARGSIQTQLNANDAAFTLTAAEITTDNNVVTLTGAAPVEVKTIRVNGIAYPLTWSSVRNWSLRIPVAYATNQLAIQGFDLRGRALTNAAAAAVVKYTGPAAVPQDNLVINEIMYAPASTNAAYVELFNNSPSVTFDLSNYELRGIDYRFPDGAMIGPQSFLVLAKDRAAFASAYGSGVAVFGQFDGNLDQDGETLRLVRRGAAPVEDVLVCEVRYANQLPWPVIASGSGVSLELIDSAQDLRHPGNWAASLAAPWRTPRAANSVARSLPPLPSVWINEVLPENLSEYTDSAGQADPWIELVNTSTDTVSLDGLYLAGNAANLTQWAFPDGLSVPAGGRLVVFADGEPDQATPTEPHASFRLTPGSGAVALSRLENDRPLALDYVAYTRLRTGRSYGSWPDGEPLSRREFAYVTPGRTNNPASALIPVAINEWMASNTGSVPDPADGHFDDWFELYNLSGAPVDLEGYSLTDTATNRFKYTIPRGYTIPPHGYLLVWADGETSQNTTNRADLHVSFSLAKSGEQIGLFAPDGSTIDLVSFGPQTSDASEGRYPDGGTPGYPMLRPTPRDANLVAAENHPPVIQPVGDRTAVLGHTLNLVVTASDPDLPAQTLTFTLDPGAPPRATINPQTGWFTWNPEPQQPPGAYPLRVRATDDGVPPMSSTADFTVTLVGAPRLGEVRLDGQQLTLAWSAIPGATYRVEIKQDLNDDEWTPLSGDILAGADEVRLELELDNSPRRFYRLRML